MLSRLRDVLVRHRNKFIIVSVVLGGSYVALKYLQKKLIKLQESQAREFLEKSRRLQHFESTESTCNELIISMGIEIMDAILKECCTNELLQQLLKNPTNKLELWEELKIVSFTRLTTLIYASSMAAVFLRIQLNLLGGYLYSDSVSPMAENVKKPVNRQKISENLKFQYLLLIKYFINEGGLSNLIRLIRSKVVAVMKELPLTKLFNLPDMEQLFWSLQMAINSDPNSDPCSKMSKYMMVPQLSDNQCDPLLEKMFNETMDILESDDASSVCSNNISRGFSVATDAIAERISETLSDQEQYNEDKSIETTGTICSESMLNINLVEIPLAKLIPLISGLTSKSFESSTQSQNLARSLITFCVVSEKCRVLGANVYETFSSV